MTSSTSDLEPQLIVPFKVTRSDFASELITMLAENDNTPLEIFETIRFEKALKVFVPMYKFEGSYSGTWRCSVERAASSIRKDPNNRYKPKSGKISGKFAVLCRACSGEELPEALQEFTQLRKYPGALTFSQEMPESGKNKKAKLLNADLVPDQVWHENGMDEVEQMARDESRRMAPGDRNFECSTNIRLSDKGTYTLVPFWYIEYSYQGKTFYFLREGYGEDTDWNGLPEDPEIEAAHERIRKQKRNRYVLGGMTIPLILAAVTAFFMQSLWLPLGVAVAGELLFAYIWFHFLDIKFYFLDPDSPYATHNRSLREEAAAQMLDQIKRSEKRLG